MIGKFNNLLICEQSNGCDNGSMRIGLKPNLSALIKKKTENFFHKKKWFYNLFYFLFINSIENIGNSKPW